MADLIRCERFAAGFNSLTVLKDVSFSIPESGVTCIMGPGGVGKTTLMRTLARLNDAFPSYWWRGRIEFDGMDYLRDVPAAEASDVVRLLVQKSKLYTASVADNLVEGHPAVAAHTREEKRALATAVLEKYGLLEEYSDALDLPAISLPMGRQRVLVLIRLANANPRCLLLDEPFRDIALEDQRLIIALLRQISTERSVIVVTHNQKYAREIGDTVHLLAAGTIVASGRCEEFFDSPPNELARKFVKLGNVWPDEEGDKAETGELRVSSDVPQPRSMQWVIPEKLASMQKPGLLGDLETDLAGLRNLGVQTLVTLTEKPLDRDLLSAHGLEAIHFPIVDMSVPELALVMPLCERISRGMDSGEVLAVHCKAGLGRTGTILACTLVYRGAAAVDAIDNIRLKNAQYVQSEKQVEFVSKFERYLNTINKIHNLRENA